MGDRLDGEDGWQVALIDDVLFDPADNSVALIVLRAGGRFQAPTDPLVLELPDSDLFVVDGHLRTTKTARKLENLSSLESTLESFEPDKRNRLLSIEALLEAPVRAASGKALGELREFVFHAKSGDLRYVIVDRPEGSPGTAKEMAIEKADVQGAGGSGGPVVVVGDAMVTSAKLVDESTPELQGKGWLRRLARRLGLTSNAPSP